jgi:hypothetical protein
MQGQQLLSPCQILQDEVCSGPKHSRQPAEQVSKAHKHGSHPIGSEENDEGASHLTCLCLLLASPAQPARLDGLVRSNIMNFTEDLNSADISD